MRRRVIPLVLSALFTVAVAAAANATPGHGGGTRKSATTRVPSRSLGAPNHGLLEGGAHLEPTPALCMVGAYAAGDACWGIRELVEAIEHAAREVRRRYPDAVLGVGHLSRRRGGEIERHHSHESGRDADLAFYLVDSAGRPVHREAFLAIRNDGRAITDPTIHFDDGRNWALLTALLDDPHAKVTHIFVASWLRTRLLAYGAKVGASPAVRARVADVLMQPHHALPHDDHFHVRIACPTSSPGCIEHPTTTLATGSGATGSGATGPGRSPVLTHSPPGLTHSPPGAAPKARAPHLPHRKLVRARSTGRMPLDAVEIPPSEPLAVAEPTPLPG